MSMTYHDRPNPGWAGVVIGLLIAGLGVVLFLDQTGLFGWRMSWSLWPFLIIGLGLARFSTPRPDGTREGGWLIFIGTWLLLNEMRVLRFRDSWPLVLVALGVHTIWKAVMRRTPPNAPQTGQGS
jgi:hypothetical protein